MFNPRKWNALCWVTLLVWLLPALPGNIPFDTDIPEPGPIEMPNGMTAYAYDQTYLIGWPFTYLEVSKSPNTPPTKTYRPFKFIVNLILIAATLIGIIYSIQTFIPKFSIRTLLIMITSVALLFPIGNWILSTENYYIQTGFMMFIYFAPLVAIIPAFIYSRFYANTENAG